MGKVDLVGTDTETSDDHELIGVSRLRRDEELLGLTLGQASMTLAVILVLDLIPTPWYWGSFWMSSSSVNARVW